MEAFEEWGDAAVGVIGAHFFTADEAKDIVPEWKQAKGKMRTHGHVRAYNWRDLFLWMSGTFPVTMELIKRLGLLLAFKMEDSAQVERIYSQVNLIKCPTKTQLSTAHLRDYLSIRAVFSADCLPKVDRGPLLRRMYKHWALKKPRRSGSNSAAPVFK